MVAYEQAVGERSSVVGQVTVSQSPFDDLDLDELSEPSLLVTVGLKRVLGEAGVLFVGLTENVQNFNNTSDVGLHVGFTRVF